MPDLVRWGLALALAGLFVACAWSNLDNLFGLSPRARRRRIAPGSRVSPIMLLGGLSGAAALWLADLAWLAWLPFVIDLPGTLGIGRRGPEPGQTQKGEPISPPGSADSAARLQHFERAVTGCLLGIAVGDALGLPYEGLGPVRARRMFPDPARYHLLPFGRGMCSDDTEHTLMLAQSLCQEVEHSDDEAQARLVAGSFGWRLRFWLLGLPAGIGFATLRAILKLWLFIPPRWSGVRSAGNGPAMRAALLGVVYGEAPERMRAMVRAITRITHTDPKAEHAAWTVALAAHLATRGEVEPRALALACRDGLGAGAAEWLALVDKAVESAARGERTAEFARSFGLAAGVSGYAFHTVPVALQAWLSNQRDFARALVAAIECGGDTDTVAAIVGGIAGAGVGREGIPAALLERLAEWPRTVTWMERLARVVARRAATGMPQAEPVPAAGALRLAARNAFFLCVVLAHGFRRLLPPY